MNTSILPEKEKSIHRLHGIDFFRAVLMILGLFYHTALIYNDGYVWRVPLAESYLFFNYISDFINTFRMETFYIISVFFNIPVLTLIAINYKLGVNSSKFTRKFSDSSYTTYSLHQPLIVIIYFLFFDSFHFPLFLEYVLIILLTFLITFSVHHWFLVKNSTLLFLFNGVLKKKA